VDHEVEVVEQHPVAGSPPFHVAGGEAERAGERLLDRLRDRENLAGRRSVADDEVVGEVAQAAEIERQDVFGLLALCGLDRKEKFLLQRVASCRYSPRS
jgi:hypothetical protein